MESVKLYRVGNKIFDKKNNRIVEYHSLDSSWNFIYVNYANGSGIYQLKENEFEPIPLDESILFKCGFIVKNKTYSLNVGGELMRYALFEKIEESKRIRFCIYFSKTKRWTLDSVTQLKETVYFNHIHQLQNIFFALTQTELTIDL